MLKRVTAEAMERISQHEWPGNVRQLENMIKQVVVRSDERIIVELIASAGHRGGMDSPGPGMTQGSYQPLVSSAPTTGGGTDDYSLKNRIGRKIAEEEKRLIAEVLTKTNWNRRKAADMLQISYRSLLYKIKDYNLNTAK